MFRPYKNAENANWIKAIIPYSYLKGVEQYLKNRANVNPSVSK